MTRYRGRHRAPCFTDTVVDNSGRITAAVVSTGILATAPVVLASPASAAISPDSVRSAIVDCESGNRNIPTSIVDENGNPASTASGYYQFTNGTWKRYGGKTATAMAASRAEQDRVFDNAVAANGLNDWAESKSCWSGKASPLRKAETPKTEGKRSSGKVAEQSGTGKRRAGTEVPDGYVVKSGDTLGKIARRFDVTGGSNAIARANGISNPDLIYPGQILN